MSFLSVENVSKCYSIEGRRVEALQDVSLEIGENEFVTVVGRSGSGKTTLLRILASLEPPTAGSVKFRGRSCSQEEPLPAGMVFQEARLMPWLSAIDNILFAYPPRERDEGLRERALKMIETVGLKGYERALPAQLSGGMAQRVALGRALVKNPPVILLDEPLGALDYFTRRTMQRELIRLYLEEKKSFIMVTHDVGEALRLGTRVVILGEGRVTRELPVDLPYPRPRSTPVFQGLIDEVLGAIGDGE
ncbi:ABC transporter ATP-binding protein [Cloacibacillus sp.]|uniref:ABC transporter ATP-binding protein n=1 Tax=Cloacibacillus sp. TaxID=2049023 RepID=UPI0025BCE040|nr:ABC transporter ATP-binding protein [Cloacibacillus sp.]MCC8056894.1 ABC transporter ATP-binding protein [Cloacibacillus sp.]